jgi:hypothetical protein
MHEPVAPFPPPKHGWTCFHCGETFRTVAEGEAHFGPVPSASPACVLKGERGLVQALRDAEKQRDEAQVRLTAARMSAAENEAVERFRATRAQNLGITSARPR